jgi:hypothetical protein
VTQSRISTSLAALADRSSVSHPSTRQNTRYGNRSAIDHDDARSMARHHIIAGQTR